MGDEAGLGVIHVNTLAKYHPPSGKFSAVKFSYKLRDRTPPDFDWPWMQFRPLIKQDGKYYVWTGFDLSPENWKSMPTHTIDASNFVQIRPALLKWGKLTNLQESLILDYSKHPDFGCGGKWINWGMLTANSSRNGATIYPGIQTNGQIGEMDDWQVELVGVQPCK